MIASKTKRTRKAAGEFRSGLRDKPLNKLIPLAGPCEIGQCGLKRNGKVSSKAINCIRQACNRCCELKQDPLKTCVFHIQSSQRKVRRTLAVGPSASLADSASAHAEKDGNTPGGADSSSNTQADTSKTTTETHKTTADTCRSAKNIVLPSDYAGKNCGPYTIARFMAQGILSPDDLGPRPTKQIIRTPSSNPREEARRRERKVISVRVWDMVSCQSQSSRSSI